MTSTFVQDETKQASYKAQLRRLLMRAICHIGNLFPLADRPLLFAFQPKGDQMTRLERHPLIPAEVEVEIPADREAADRMRHQIERRLNDCIEQFGGWPEKEPVRMKIESERGRFHNAPYRELSVTYVGERGEVIPAYLLIPTEGKPPYPAVVANHQCANDCDIGKDAVVGKAHHRPDQVYGFELVQRGYVVLAADSINCGERNVEGLRKQARVTDSNRSVLESSFRS